MTSVPLPLTTFSIGFDMLSLRVVNFSHTVNSMPVNALNGSVSSPESAFVLRMFPSGVCMYVCMCLFVCAFTLV